VNLRGRENAQKRAYLVHTSVWILIGERIEAVSGRGCLRVLRIDPEFGVCEPRFCARGGGLGLTSQEIKVIEDLSQDLLVLDESV